MAKTVLVEISARHVHVTQETLEILFGKGHTLTHKKDLSQPGQFACEEKVTVVDYANGGRSARNFINEGSLAKIAETIKAGDYLFIQFGHNDCSNGSGYLEDRYVPLGTPDASGVYPVTAGVEVETPSSLQSKYGDTFYSYDCGGTFKWYLLQYINVARDAGAIPVLVTPVSRLSFDSDGFIQDKHDSTDGTTGTQVTSGNAYVKAMQQLAAEEGVLIIDATDLTRDMYEAAYKADANANGNSSPLAKQALCTGDNLSKDEVHPGTHEGGDDLINDHGLAQRQGDLGEHLPAGAAVDQSSLFQFQRNVCIDRAVEHERCH